MLFLWAVDAIDGVGILLMAEGDRERGLYGKYIAYRVAPFAGRADALVREPFFLLKYTTDPHARVALAAYADSCEADYPVLAADLRKQLET